MEHYQNPPITEALFDLQVELPSMTALPQLDALSKKHESKFPKKKPRRQFRGNFKFEEGIPAATQTVDLGVDGYLCWSNDDLEVAQFRMDGFAYSRLKPYLGWSKAFPTAMELWSDYKKTLKPITIKRAAVRFINRIEIPETKFDLNDYFLAPVELPKIEGVELESFMKQVIFKVPSYGCRAVIIQTLAPNPKPMSTAIIFDLEVSIDINSDASEDELTKVFLRLRAAKNELFEKSITDKTRGLFK